MISASIVGTATERALASGALQPIETETTIVEDAGVRFVLRAASSLARKAFEPPRPDPLGDYEPDLFVGELPPAHYVLLNKFSVRTNHVLVVTREFEHQERLLTPADFSALARLLEELDWLGFYNGGTQAGASQPRKHLQLVPLPIAEDVPAAVPMEPLLESGAAPFRHAFAPVGKLYDLHALYRELLARCAISALADERQSAPYNLLVTRRWMLVVPRRREHYESISVNALGFAGSLFVRNRRELDLVRSAGPMSVLRAVAMD